MVLIPLIPAIPQLFLQVVTDHQGYSGAFTPPLATCLGLPPQASPAANTPSMLVSMVPLPHLLVSTISLTKAVLGSSPMNMNAAARSSSSFSPVFRS